ncbi:unnamed protein product [Amoebophrya sp. A25]|nr:unnamed protein product [Amoebophrya sp. A25]|eukprot:GSA25T00001197001.1
MADYVRAKCPQEGCRKPCGVGLNRCPGAHRYKCKVIGCSRGGIALTEGRPVERYSMYCGEHRANPPMKRAKKAKAMKKVKKQGKKTKGSAFVDVELKRQKASNILVALPPESSSEESDEDEEEDEDSAEETEEDQQMESDAVRLDLPACEKCGLNMVVDVGEKYCAGCDILMEDLNRGKMSIELPPQSSSGHEMATSRTDKSASSSSGINEDTPGACSSRASPLANSLEEKAPESNSNVVELANQHATAYVEQVERAANVAEEVEAIDANPESEAASLDCLTILREVVGHVRNSDEQLREAQQKLSVVVGELSKNAVTGAARPTPKA